MAAKKWKILFIKDIQSMFDTNSKIFDELFDTTDFVQGTRRSTDHF